MNLLKSLSSAALMLLLPVSGAYADEVCTTKQVSVPVYAGWASCTVYSNNQWTNIDQYVSSSYSSSLRIYSGTLSCTAQVPYIGNQTVNVEECNTVIGAVIGISQNYQNNIGHNIVRISSHSDANEGENITGYKWWIDDVYKSASSTFQYDNFDSGRYVNIKLQVTDSSGATDTSTRRVYIYAHSGQGNCGAKAPVAELMNSGGEQKDGVASDNNDNYMPTCV